MSTKPLFIITTIIMLLAVPSIVVESSQQQQQHTNKEACDMTWEFDPSICNREPPSAVNILCRYGPPKNVSHCTDLSIGVIKNEPYNSELLPGKGTTYINLSNFEMKIVTFTYIALAIENHYDIVYRRSIITLVPR